MLEVAPLSLITPVCVPIPSQAQTTRPSVDGWLNSPSVPGGSELHYCYSSISIRPEGYISINKTHRKFKMLWNFTIFQ